jgi:hypothetical protein
VTPTCLLSVVQFNALVVTPIVEKAKGTEAAKKELAELLAEAAEKVKTNAGLAAAAAAAASAAELHVFHALLSVTVGAHQTAYAHATKLC